MSHENVELLYRAHDAFNRRDIDAFLALFDPDAEFFAGLVELEGGGPGDVAVDTPSGIGIGLIRRQNEWPARAQTLP